jgi:hypothetical protein
MSGTRKIMLAQGTEGRYLSKNRYVGSERTGRKYPGKDNNYGSSGAWNKDTNVGPDVLSTKQLQEKV